MPEELSFRNRRNRGEVDRYYVSNSHEAVLDKDTFAAVQEMLKKNLEKEALKAAPQKYFFSGRIFCVDCLNKKKKVNNGQKTKYLVVNDHPAIIHRIVNSIQVTKDLNLRIFIKGGVEIVEPLFLPEEESA